MFRLSAGGVDAGPADASVVDASSDGGGSPELRYYATCGDPVCRPEVDAGTPQDACGSLSAGDACANAGDSCDPGTGCGVRLVCADSDPRMQPGGCPISRAHFKRDIAYLDDAQLRQVSKELLDIPLATYRYRQDPSERTHLGFILEDVEPALCTDGARDQVDLYGYTSMAVATIQLQQAQLQALTSELEALHARLSVLERERISSGAKRPLPAPTPATP